MTISPLYGIYAAMAGLLALGGALKAAKPSGTANALAAAGLPAARGLVRTGGAVEAVVGLTALAAGGPMAAGLVALSYLAFSLFVLLALRLHTPLASCGCFGEIDAPPTVLHLVITVTAAAVAVVVAVQGAPGVLSVLGAQPWAGVPFLLLTSTTGYLAYLAMAVLPRTMQAARDGRPA